MKQVSIIVLAFVAAFSPLTSGAVSFVCSSNSPLAEALICSNTGLSAKDDEMVAIYNVLRNRRMAFTSQQDLKVSQTKWLFSRNSCKTLGCLNDAYDARIRKLKEYKLEVYEVEVSPPQCSNTSISDIGARLGGDPRDSGTAISYQNELYGISYDYVAAISERSRVGDRVKVCWIRRLLNCPPDDDRGNTYQTINLRTGEKWELPDDAHICGGA